MSNPAPAVSVGQTLTLRKDFGEIQRMEMLDYQEERNQESKVANPVDDKCFLAGAAAESFVNQ